MIVTLDNFDLVIAELEKHHTLALDTETTGLRWFQGHRLFSIIIATEETAYYFNFQDYGDESPVLYKEHLALLQERLFSTPDRLWYLHNAKFDMHMLANEGLSLAGVIHCTEVMARLLFNTHPSYKLADVAARQGLVKSKAVDEYISKQKLFTVHNHPGKKIPTKTPHFDKVPFAVIAPYGLIDGKITNQIGVAQRAEFRRFYNSFHAEVKLKASALVANEREVTKVAFDMEREGIPIDVDYCRDALQACRKKSLAAADKFFALTGAVLVDSAKALSPILKTVGVEPGKTAKGADSYAKAVLLNSKHPVAEAILEYRRFSKVANTYFYNFLELSADGKLHGNLRQGGTATGRFSMSEPNLQNLKKAGDVADVSEEGLDEMESLKVRRVFIPPPDYAFVMIDYDQQEYRLMLDQAGEESLIEQVLAGLDVHTATALKLGIERERAKTMNFMLIYGGGIDKLALSLGISRNEAISLLDNYFKNLPKVVGFKDGIKHKASREGKVLNWAGRCYYIAREDAYKAPNAVIQGGGADVMRFAMVRIHKFLQPYRSKMLLTVHDELLFKIHKDEFWLVPKLKEIMETTYPHKKLPLTCSVSHSFKSWADKVKGPPQ